MKHNDDFDDPDLFSRPVVPPPVPQDQDAIDELHRRWRRKFSAMLALGFVLGLLMAGYMLYANR
jgi:hypothetical protein